MKPEQDSNKFKVASVSFISRDFTELIRQNCEVLEFSHVMVIPHLNEIVVKDGSRADLQIRSHRPGFCVPTGIQTVDGILYRSYQVESSLLQALNSAV